MLPASLGPLALKQVLMAVTAAGDLRCEAGLDPLKVLPTTAEVAAIAGPIPRPFTEAAALVAGTLQDDV
jgi:hypothetical protein